MAAAHAAAVAKSPVKRHMSLKVPLQIVLKAAMSFPTRKIGNDSVSAIGFGAMGISTFYGKTESNEERFKVLDAAYEQGCTFWDTADIYGDSEELIGEWCVVVRNLVLPAIFMLIGCRFKRTGKRNEIFLATKFGIVMKPGQQRGIDGSPEYVHQAFNKSISRLGVDKVDLYYLHR